MISGQIANAVADTESFDTAIKNRAYAQHNGGVMLFRNRLVGLVVVIVIMLICMCVPGKAQQPSPIKQAAADAVRQLPQTIVQYSINKSQERINRDQQETERLRIRSYQQVESQRISTDATVSMDRTQKEYGQQQLVENHRFCQVQMDKGIMDDCSQRQYASITPSSPGQNQSSNAQPLTWRVTGPTNQTAIINFAGFGNHSVQTDSTGTGWVVNLGTTQNAPVMLANARFELVGVAGRYCVGNRHVLITNVVPGGNGLYTVSYNQDMVEQCLGIQRY